MSKLQKVNTAVETGKIKFIAGLVREALAGGYKATEILNTMIDAMGVVGEKFSAGELFVPEMLIAGKTIQIGVDVLKPELTGDTYVSLGKCIIGTVAGDLHDIGKNLVSLMIESAGFEMIDLGVDVSIEKFIKAIKSNPNTNIVALSALLTTTMPAMKKTVAAIKEGGLPGIKVIVGGAPISKDFADEIGADAYAPDAGSAALKVKELVQKNAI